MLNFGLDSSSKEWVNESGRFSRFVAGL
jgi:hypothetical protein